MYINQMCQDSRQIENLVNKSIYNRKLFISVIKINDLSMKTFRFSMKLFSFLNHSLFDQ